MATNAELTTKIQETAPLVNVEITGDELDAMSNKQLTAKLKELTNRLAAAEKGEDMEKVEGVYTVAASYNLTSLRGVIPSGEQCSAKDFAGGQESIDTLKAAGILE